MSLIIETFQKLNIFETFWLSGLWRKDQNGWFFTESSFTYLNHSIGTLTEQIMFKVDEKKVFNYR